MASKHLINIIRSFNRNYTSRLGILNSSIHKSGFSLVEGRILYELGKETELLASDIAEKLHIDEGYLSRIIKKFEKKRLITRGRSKDDARRRPIKLSVSGRSVLKTLNSESDRQIAEMFSHLTAQEQSKLSRAIRVFEKSLSSFPAARKE